ncbi:helix-turn-helix domain-containing protein [Saccharopolyspora sp. NPDC050389]|uniref:IclR family transcriptional regulator n=1 Tax=Saccharopolyspora sp. NPDC050389 TaxID=3155516 RepID=UPI0033F92866
MVERAKNDGARSQTLSRGIQVLELLAAAERPRSIDEIAADLGVHRSIVYRIVRTLEDHRLVARDSAGRCAPGAGLAVLAHGVARDLQSVAVPELAAVAADLAMTSFVVVHDHGECVTLASVEPRRAAGTVAEHPGTRHPLEHGAPGVALLALLGAEGLGEDVAARVAEARRQGYATSRDEVISGLSSVAVPIPSRGPTCAAVAVVYVSSDREPAELAERLQVAANAIGAQVG